MNADLVAETRSALAHLHDLAYLQTHPLARRLGTHGTTSRAEGRLLRQRLLEAVDELRPGQGARSAAAAAQAHRLIQLRYVDGRQAAEVQAALGIGRSEFYRDLARAVDAVASVLRARLGGPEVAAPSPTTVRPEDAAPVPLTRLFGRRAEIAAARSALATSRLVTLTGPPGIGKTRLAWHVAEELRAERGLTVRLVELADVAEAGSVQPAVMAAFGLAPSPSHSLAAALALKLGDGEALLALDNCEHLIDACAELAAELLGRCGGLRILATSRERLGVPGEVVCVVPPLALPPAPARGGDGATPGRGQDPALGPEYAALVQYDAVGMFVDRARAVVPGFRLTAANAGAVAELCWQLEGIPLAIELAAIWVRSLPIDALVARLDDRFRLLAGGRRAVPRRQRALRAAVEWSHALLSEDERTLFRRLAVFRGGWTLDAAEAVCADAAIPVSGGVAAGDVLDLLTALVDKSLVTVEADGRYRLLETLRAFAAERLADASEEESLCARHAAYFRTLIKDAEWRMHSAMAETLTVLAAEHDNIRAALRWSLSAEAGAETCLRLVASLGPFWFFRGHAREGQTWARTALRRRGEASTASVAGALLALGGLGQVDGLFADGLALAEEALALYRDLGDRRAMVEALLRAMHLARMAQDTTRGLALAEEGIALARSIAAAPELAEALFHHARHLADLGEVPRARAEFEEAIALSAKVGDRWNESFAMGELAMLLTHAGEYASAREIQSASLAIKRELDLKRGIAFSLFNLGLLAELEGDAATARSLYVESVQVYRDAGEITDVSRPIEGLAGLARPSDPRRAARLLGAGDRLAGPNYPRLIRRPDREDLIEAVRRDLSPGDFEACWSAGQELTPEQAIAEALAEPEPTPS